MILKGKIKIIFFSTALITAILVAVFGFSFWREKNSQFLKPPLTETPVMQTFLQSAFNNKKIYDDIFSDLPKLDSSPEIKAGIVAHHFLARELIAQFYNQIANQNTTTIFLVSPDHFNNFFKSGVVAYSSLQPWQTPFGNIESDKNYIDALIKDGSVQIGDSIIGLEHGIYVEVPFIKKFFPQARLVPLVIKNVFGYNEFLVLGKKIKGISNDRAIMIVSSDFSHDVSGEQAVQQDKKSIEILKDLEISNLDGVNNDCRACLALLDGFLGHQNYFFSLIDNKNSFDFSGEDSYNVTSYVSGYYVIKKF